MRNGETGQLIDWQIDLFGEATESRSKNDDEGNGSDGSGSDGSGSDGNGGGNGNNDESNADDDSPASTNSAQLLTLFAGLLLAYCIV